MILEIFKIFCNKTKFFVWRKNFTNTNIKSFEKHSLTMENKHVKHKIFSNV